VINRKAAKALGLAMPPSLLLRPAPVPNCKVSLVNGMDSVLSAACTLVLSSET
jgi:hypothetical protein